MRHPCLIPFIQTYICVSITRSPEIRAKQRKLLCLIYWALLSNRRTHNASRPLASLSSYPVRGRNLCLWARTRFVCLASLLSTVIDSSRWKDTKIEKNWEERRRGRKKETHFLKEPWKRERGLVVSNPTNHSWKYLLANQYPLTHSGMDRGESNGLGVRVVLIKHNRNPAGSWKKRRDILQNKVFQSRMNIS